MDDVARQLEEARPHLAPRWDEERALHRFQRRRRRRTAARAAAASAVVLLAVGATAYWAGYRGGRVAGVSSGSTSSTSSTIHFADGSKAVPESEETELVVTEQSDTSTTVELLRGRSQFTVTPRAEREFRVRAGEVLVTVLGTEFSVARQGERTGVWVSHGRVRIQWSGGMSELTAGGRGWFGPGVPSEGTEDEGEALEPDGGFESEVVGPDGAVSGDPDAADPVTREPRRHRPPPGPDWRKLAEVRDYEASYRALRRGPAPRRVEDLLLAADVTRLGGHPDEAVPYLERVLKLHSRDSRAALAAFTLGRLHLDELSRPRQAAQAFARARALAPRGHLAEDALAREVEAWARAGDADRAAALARQYVARYPEGRRVRSVRKHGGLD